VNFIFLYRRILIGYFFNQITPLGLGGDVTKILWLKNINKSNLNLAINSVIFDRLIALISISLIIAFNFPFLYFISKGSNYTFHYFSFAILLILLSLFSFKFLNKIKPLFFLVYIDKEINKILNDKVYFFKTIIISTIIHISTCVIFYLLSIGLDIQLSFSQSIILVPIVILLSNIPLTIGGWGLREGASIYILQIVNISTSEALTLSVSFGILSIFMGLLSGFMWIILEKLEFNIN